MRAFNRSVHNTTTTYQYLYLLFVDFKSIDTPFFRREIIFVDCDPQLIRDDSLSLSLSLEKYSSIIIIMWMGDPRLLFSDVRENSFVDFKSIETKITGFLVLKSFKILIKFP